MSYTQIINYWPSVAALAEDMKEKPDTVRKWKDRNSIPSDKWFRLVGSAKERGYQVTLELLSSIASEKSAAA